MSKDVTSGSSVVHASDAVFGWLPKLASGLVGFTALAYIVGWRWSITYYGALGAPWAVHLLTVQQIAQSASWFVAVATFTTLISTAGVISGDATSRSLGNSSAISSLCAMALYFLFDKTWSWFNLRYGPYLDIAAGILFAFSVGVSISELVALVAKGKPITKYLSVWLNAVILAALIYGPSALARGVADMDSLTPSNLPVVTLEASDSRQWRLIGPVGGQILLMTTEIDAQKRLFRLVDAISITSIAHTLSISHAPEAKASDLPVPQGIHPSPANAQSCAK